MKVISGGQTGVDRAALDVALALGIECGGWCPKGRLAEDGTIDSRYPLQETPSSEYIQRTEWNIRDANGVLILTWGAPVGGTQKAVNFCSDYGKPLLQIDLSKAPDAGVVKNWIKNKQIKILSVGGPRVSEVEDIYLRAKTFLEEALKIF